MHVVFASVVLAFSVVLGVRASAQEPQVLLEEITPAAFPMYVHHAGDERLFIIERRGSIRIWTKKDGLFETPFLDIDPLVGEGSERGMYTIAFHPDYENNRYFFISYYESTAEIVVVYRYQVSATDPNLADPNSALRILEVPQPEHIHNGGQILFGPDGYLWMGFGDGNAGDGGCRVQNNDYFLGKILRIDVDAIQDGVPFSYGIPPDNPFVGANDPLDEIPDELYAKGFRHPWRFSIDFPTGDVWIGDVGGGSWEEIDRIPGTSPGGENFGWKIMEGPICHSDPVPSNCPEGTPPCFSPEYTPPLYTYSHANTPNGTELTGCAVIGGYVYRGSAIPELVGRYVFTDYCARSIRTLEEISPGEWGNPKELVEGVRGPNTMGVDAAGELYIGNLSKVFKLVSATGKHEQSSAQQGCIKAMNQSAAEVARQRLRANAECVKYAGRRQLHRLDGVPADDLSAEACFRDGLPKRIQRALDNLARRESRRCRAPGRPEQLPDFGYTSAGTVASAGLNAAARLSASLLGPDADAAIVFLDENADAARCQGRIAAKLQVLFNNIWRRASDGKTRALRGRIGSPARTGSEFADKVLRHVDEDTRRIPRAVASLVSELGGPCSGSGVALGQLFPGDCASAPDANAFADCLLEHARCHFCREFETADSLTIDCDEWDNDAIDGSCPSETELLCSAAGTGINWDAAPVNCGKLQDYRLFVDPSDPTQGPDGGGVPFHLTTPLFSDYALKYRFVFLPPGGQAVYDPDEPFDFPVGTIIAKTFSFAHDLRDPGLGEDVIETRLLIRRDSGWEGLPYIWDPATGQAYLSVEGGSMDVSWIHTDGSPRATTYQIPSAAQCGNCHITPLVAGDAPIGPKARLLNRDFPYPSGTENQLDHWSALGLLTGAPPSPSAPRLPIWDQPADGTLEGRARAYLESNCAHCHNPVGRAGFTGLDLRHDRPLDDEYGICQVSDFDQAPGLTFNIVPGDPDQSIAIFRMSSALDGIKMPEIAKSVVHQEGVDLARAWIQTLSGTCP